jgi:hypothetical protein
VRSGLETRDDLSLSHHPTRPIGLVWEVWPPSRLEDAVKTQKDRAEERRQEKLAQIQDEVAKGKLTIRQMTPEERAAHPPRPRGGKSRGR